MVDSIPRVCGALGTAMLGSVTLSRYALHRRYYPLQGRSGRLLSSLPPLLKQPPPCRTLSCRAGAAAPFRRVPERGFRAAGGAGLGRALAQHSACQPADSGEHPERTLEHPAAAAGTGAGSLGLARRAGRGGGPGLAPRGHLHPPARHLLPYGDDEARGAHLLHQVPTATKTNKKPHILSLTYANTLEETLGFPSLGFRVLTREPLLGSGPRLRPPGPGPASDAKPPISPVNFPDQACVVKHPCRTAPPRPALNN
eukprot:1195488-Prorocentrum_minimum.AAC.2